MHDHGSNAPELKAAFLRKNLEAFAYLKTVSPELAIEEETRWGDKKKADARLDVGPIKCDEPIFILKPLDDFDTIAA